MHNETRSVYSVNVVSFEFMLTHSLLNISAILLYLVLTGSTTYYFHLWINSYCPYFYKLLWVKQILTKYM